MVTLNGAVALKGPVKSDEEKEKIAAMTANILSAKKVTNAPAGICCLCNIPARVLAGVVYESYRFQEQITRRT
ncbi:BON domain-containing protein [Tunturiibacter lichenicola]|uniref:BON domain-containing protein n=1 Tax=Tunturiibacter lichenicola TaxID=2051959 RepID=UPI003D9B0910